MAFGPAFSVQRSFYESVVFHVAHPTIIVVRDGAKVRRRVVIRVPIAMPPEFPQLLKPDPPDREITKSHVYVLVMPVSPFCLCIKALLRYRKESDAAH